MPKFFSQSLQGKLSLIMILSTIVPLLFLGVFSFITATKVSEEITKQTGIDALKRMQDSLKFIAQDVQDMSIFLTGDNDVQQYMSGFDLDPPEKARILAMTMNLIQSKDYISNITIYSSNKITPLQTNSVYYSELSGALLNWDLNGKTWTTLYNNRTTKGTEQVFSFLRGVKSTQNFEPLGFIAISISEKALSNYLAKPNFGVGYGDILLLDKYQTVISGNRKEWLSLPWEQLFPDTIATEWSTASSGAFTYGKGSGKTTVLYDRMPELEWTLVGLVPYDLYSKNNNYIWLLTVTAVGLAVALIAGLVLIFVRYVTKPLKVVSRLLERLDPNEPMPLYQFESPDEVGRLVGSYNKLGEHIKGLKKQVIMLESRKKEADMQALQAQINPHFLYNTLSSIHWMALMSKDQRIADMVGALSDFLRFSLNKGKDYCRVEQEINHVKNFGVIQAIRFPNMFSFTYDIDQRVIHYPMLKLLLQPLVENAMVHGIQRASKPGTIYVFAILEGNGMRFTVQDNGAGIEDQELAEIIAKLKLPLAHEAELPNTSDNGYGLRNVNERLILHYGEEAQLTIVSTEGKGTQVSFKIPFKGEFR